LISRLRSVLFAPADRRELVGKLPAVGADAVILDLEDGVAAAAKSKARIALQEGQSSLASKVPLFVRVNGLRSPWFTDDIAVLTAELAGVVVPKIESAQDVLDVGDALARAGLSSLGVVAGIETVAGVEFARECLGAPVMACYFGAEDYISDLGGVRTPEGNEVLYARSRVAIAARLAGIPALDQVAPRIGDLDQLRADSALGRALGYAGKMCIHPSQVPVVNEAFSASEAEIERAKRLIAAYEDALAQGRGAISFEGQMVDQPLLQQARAMLDRAGMAGPDLNH
jgi:citrate lyase subunit beta/citryl-CoA lyase